MHACSAHVTCHLFPSARVLGTHLCPTHLRSDSSKVSSIRRFLERSFLVSRTHRGTNSGPRPRRRGRRSAHGPAPGRRGGCVPEGRPSWAPQERSQTTPPAPARLCMPPAHAISPSRIAADKSLPTAVTSGSSCSWRTRNRAMPTRMRSSQAGTKQEEGTQDNQVQD